MHFLKRFAQGELRLNRIEAFSDGVFAIVVTLLVLELRVPILHDRASVSELEHRLVDLVPKFLSWLISFVIVCKFWLNHHHLLTFARHATYGMVWLNSIFFDGAGVHSVPYGIDGRISDKSARRKPFRSRYGGEYAALYRVTELHHRKLTQTRAGECSRPTFNPEIFRWGSFLSARSRRDVI